MDVSRNTEMIGFAAVEVTIPYPCFLFTAQHQQCAGLCFSSPPPHLLDMLIGAWPGFLATELKAIWLVQSERIFRNKMTMWTVLHKVFNHRGIEL